MAATEARLAELADAHCDYTLHASLTAWHDGSAAVLRAAVERFSLRSLKLYLAYLETIGLVAEDLDRAMQTAADLDLTVLLHCEDGAEVSRRQAELLAAGHTSPDAHPRSRPPNRWRTPPWPPPWPWPHAPAAAPTSCTCRPPTPWRPSRRRGPARRCSPRPAPSTCCWTTASTPAPSRRRRPVMSPPLRSPRHVAALAPPSAAASSTWWPPTTAPSTDAQKDRGRDDFTRIPGGAAGVRLRLSMLQTVGVASGRLAPWEWVQLVSTRPAEVFGLAPRKGTLEVGADADLVLWDPRRAWVVGGPDDQPRDEPSVYDGLPVVGQASQVWLRGQVAATAGKAAVEVGRGRRVAPPPAG